MGCNCKWCELVIAIVILVFAFWMTAWSKWIIVIAAIVLLLHSFLCRSCMMCEQHKGGMAKSMPASKKKRR